MYSTDTEARQNMTSDQLTALRETAAEVGVLHEQARKHLLEMITKTRITSPSVAETLAHAYALITAPAAAQRR